MSNLCHISISLWAALALLGVVADLIIFYFICQLQQEKKAYDALITSKTVCQTKASACLELSFHVSEPAFATTGWSGGRRRLEWKWQKIGHGAQTRMHRPKRAQSHTYRNDWQPSPNHAGSSGLFQACWRHPERCSPAACIRQPDGHKSQPQSSGHNEQTNPPTHQSWRQSQWFDCQGLSHSKLQACLV